MQSRLVLLVAVLAVSACTARPGSEVLTPDRAPLPEGARSIRVLTVTTRGAEADAPETYGATRGSSPIWLDYDISVPPGHQVGRIEWPTRETDPAKTFALRSRTAMSRAEFAREISGARVGVYIHGFNTRYQEALFPPPSFPPTCISPEYRSSLPGPPRGTPQPIWRIATRQISRGRRWRICWRW